MATTPRQSFTRPAQDEWGMFDPQQAGLAALFARLDSKYAAAHEDSRADEAVLKPATAPRPALRDAT